MDEIDKCFAFGFLAEIYSNTETDPLLSTVGSIVGSVLFLLAGIFVVLEWRTRYWRNRTRKANSA